jgi:hypothetical protein
MLNLSGRKFSGCFFRNPEYVQEELEYRKETEELNKKYDFDFEVTSFDPETGLFTAITKDHFGKGIAAGAARGDVIKFLKVYANLSSMPLLEPPFLLEHGEFRIFEYFGNAKGYEDSIMVEEGSYKPLHENERSGGFWSMKPIPGTLPSGFPKNFH